MAGKKSFIAVGLVGILLMIAWACSVATAQTENIPRGGTLKVAFAEPAQLNPILGGGISNSPSCDSNLHQSASVR